MKIKDEKWKEGGDRCQDGCGAQPEQQANILQPLGGVCISLSKTGFFITVKCCAWRASLAHKFFRYEDYISTEDDTPTPLGKFCKTL